VSSFTGLLSRVAAAAKLAADRFLRWRDYSILASNCSMNLLSAARLTALSFQAVVATTGLWKVVVSIFEGGCALLTCFLFSK
jgi:hypothetical protein